MIYSKMRKEFAKSNNLYTRLTTNKAGKVASGEQVKASLCGGCLYEHCNLSTKTRGKRKNENLHDNAFSKVALLKVRDGEVRITQDQKIRFTLKQYID